MPEIHSLKLLKIPESEYSKYPDDVIQLAELIDDMAEMVLYDFPENVVARRKLSIVGTGLMDLLISHASISNETLSQIAGETKQQLADLKEAAEINQSSLATIEKRGPGRPPKNTTAPVSSVPVAVSAPPATAPAIAGVVVNNDNNEIDIHEELQNQIDNIEF